MNRSTSLVKRLGILHPIIQAPMAGVATPQLAAAVSNAGGLGSLGIASSTAVQARQMIEDTRALTSKPFNVNVFCHAPARRDRSLEADWLLHLEPLFAEVGVQVPVDLEEIYPSFVEEDESFDLLMELRPPVVSFHFGLPSPERISILRQNGIVTLATATSIEEGLQCERAGIDAVVAQGVEAGGHRGVFDPDKADERLSTAVLVRLLVREIAIPIVAAGGIMDGQGIRAALDFGASAAQLGTAFVLCPESAADTNYRENLMSDAAATTRLTSVISGRPARGMMNRLISHGEAPGSPPPAAYPVAYDAARQLNAAASRRGIHEFGAQWAGQGAPLARAMPAGELVATLVAEWQGHAWGRVVPSNSMPTVAPA